MRFDLHLVAAVVASIAFCVVPATVAAASKQWKFAVNTPAAFQAQAEKVREEMSENGRYGAINRSDRSAVESDLERIDGLLRGAGSLEALNDRQQVDLMNAQERINAVLTRNDGNRLVCTMESRSGSHFKQKTCRTLKQSEEIRRKGQEAYQQEFMRGGGTQPPGN